MKEAEINFCKMCSLCLNTILIEEYDICRVIYSDTGVFTQKNVILYKDK